MLAVMPKQSTPWFNGKTEESEVLYGKPVLGPYIVCHQLSYLIPFV